MVEQDFIRFVLGALADFLMSEPIFPLWSMVLVLFLIGLFKALCRP